MNIGFALTYIAQVTFGNETKRGKIHYMDLKKYAYCQRYGAVFRLYFWTPLHSHAAGYFINRFTMALNYFKYS